MMLTPEQVWLDRRDKLNLTELKACGDAMAQQLDTKRIMIEAQLAVKGRIRDEASKRGRDASSTVSELESLIELIDAQQARIAELEQDAARYLWIANVPATDLPEGFWRDWLWQRPGDSEATFTYCVDQARGAWPENASD